MDAVAVALMALISAIGAIHLSWALGNYWPGTDALSLHARVVGTADRAFLGRWAWALLAACFFGASGIVWIGNQPIESAPHAFLAYAGYLVLILVFGFRGLAPYVTRVFDYARTTPFFTLNLRYYAPTCLLIAAGLIVDYPPGLERFIS